MNSCQPFALEWLLFGIMQRFIVQHHLAKQIKTFIENVGCQLIFLPPYSSDFNPIEKYWAKLNGIIPSRAKRLYF
jgi:transposase